MKSDYNGLVEQSEMNQSVDENFNNIPAPTPVTSATVLVTIVCLQTGVLIILYRLIARFL
jgi:hypothetical protein